MSTTGEGESTVLEQTPTRSEEFYDDLIVFKVDKTLYRVPRYGFEKWSQSAFKDMFSLPQGDEKTDAEGQSDESPIDLTGCCTSDEFTCLLRAMYPRYVNIHILDISRSWSVSQLLIDDTTRLSSDHPQQMATNMPKEGWISVLKLARLWDMPKVAVLAISNLDEVGLTAIEKITLGKPEKYSVPDWLEKGYVELLQDPDAWSLETLGSLGWEAAARLMWIVRLESAAPQTLTGAMLRCQYQDHNLNQNDVAVHCYSCRSAVITKIDVPALVRSAREGNVAYKTPKNVREIFQEEIAAAKAVHGDPFAPRVTRVYP